MDGEKAVHLIFILCLYFMPVCCKLLIERERVSSLACVKAVIGDHNSEVKVIARGRTSCSHISDHLSLTYILSLAYSPVILVHIFGIKVSAVIYNGIVSAASVPAVTRDYHDTVGYRIYRGIAGSADIQSAVEVSASAAEWVAPPSEWRCDIS